MEEDMNDERWEKEQKEEKYHGLRSISFDT